MCFSRLRSRLTLISLSAVALLVSACSSDAVTGGDVDPSVDLASDAGDISFDFSPTDGADTATDDAEGDGSDDASTDTGGSPTLGQGCSGDSDCERGEYCIFVNSEVPGQGYCTVFDCVDDSDCLFGGDNVFCCSNFGEYRGCFREGPGAVCGDETGLQGDDCSEGGQSDCDGETTRCIHWYQDDFCAEVCDPDDENPCGTDNWCYPVPQLPGICVPRGDTPALSSCTEDPNSCDEGMLCDGGFGDDPLLYSYCAELCITNRQCTETEWCRVAPGQAQGTCVPVGTVGEWGSCAEDRWACEQGLWCLNENTRYARCMSLCRRDGECDETFSCQLVNETFGICMPDGDRTTGDSCGDDPYACSDDAICMSGYGAGYDSNAYCSASCLADPGVCPDGFVCQSFGADGSYCMPDGDGAAGDECASPLDCANGNYCIYAEGDVPGQCAAACSSSDECGVEEWCSANDSSEGGVCLADGSLQPGDPCESNPFECPEGTICGGAQGICLPECTGDPDGCPTGMYCLDPNPPSERRYCFPYGEVAEGAPCSDPYECEQDSYCSFIDDEGNGFCSHGCESDSECPADYFCFRSRDFSACVPEGEGAAGTSCATDRFACAAGHLCLYSDTAQAYCSLDCTGFPQMCAEGESCRFMGWDISFCMPVGEGAPGSSCVADVNHCDISSICLEAGTETAFCAELCTFDADACDEGYTCFFFDSGLGVCVPPDYDTSKPPPGGRPI